LRFDAAGRLAVWRSPVEPALAASPTAAGRLFFVVGAPIQTGAARLRCNVYYGQTLVHSRVVRRLVAWRSVRPLGWLWLLLERARGRRPAIVDFALSGTLSPAYLAGLAPHRLSLILNDGENGTHNLRFFGANGDQLFK